MCSHSAGPACYIKQEQVWGERRKWVHFPDEASQAASCTGG